MEPLFARLQVFCMQLCQNWSQPQYFHETFLTFSERLLTRKLMVANERHTKYQKHEILYQLILLILMTESPI